MSHPTNIINMKACMDECLLLHPKTMNVDKLYNVMLYLLHQVNIGYNYSKVCADSNTG